MTKSLVFLQYDPLQSREEYHLQRSYIYFLQNTKKPELVICSADMEIGEFPESRKEVLEELKHASILSLLIQAQESHILLILPEDVFISWHEALLGKKGKKSIAFSLDLGDEGYQVRENWILQKNFKIKLPIKQTLGLEPNLAVHQILIEKEKQVEESLLLLFQTAEEEEGVHQVRVQCRTLRSLLDFVKPWTDKELNKYCRNSLKLLAREFSFIRDQDVLLEQIEKDAKKAPEEAQQQYKEIFEYIQARRHVAMNEFLRNVVMQDLLVDIPLLRNNMQILVLEADALSHKINEAYYNRYIQFQVQAANTDFSHPDSAHDLRKDAKAMRYVFENFGQWISSVDDEKGKEFKKVQKVLGDLCDVRNHQDYLQSLMDLSQGQWNLELQKMVEENALREIEIVKDVEENTRMK